MLSKTFRSILLSAVLPFALACSSMDEASDCEDGTCDSLLDGYIAVFPHTDSGRRDAMLYGEAYVELEAGGDASISISAYDDGRYEIAYTECYTVCAEPIVIEGDWKLLGDVYDFEGAGTGRVIQGEEIRVVKLELEARVAPSRPSPRPLILVAE